MKHLHITFVLTVLMSMVGAKASAHDIAVANIDGVTIYYNYINDNTELEVCYRGSSSDSYSNEYSGDVVIPETINYDGTTYSVTSIGDYAFYRCSGLTSVTIPNSVTSIGNNSFSGCSGLTSVTIPNSVTSIGTEAFSYCSGLTSVSIPNSVTSIGDYAFKNCNKLISVNINCNAIVSKNYSSSGLSKIFGDQVETYIIGDSVTSIGEYAFRSCSSLTSVTIPNSVTSIGSSAFYGCSGLTSVAIPNSVTSIEGWAFEYCSGLTSVTIPNSVTSIESSAFTGCSSLTSIIVDDNNKVYDSRGNCNAIISTADNTLRVGCKNTIIPNSVTSIGNYAFGDCSGLTSVTIPNSVTSIGSSAFSSCSGLTSVTIPNSVTTIGNYAFKYCRGLTSVTIPNSVTSIGDGAFSYCSGLTSITIPNSVTSIGYSAFSATGITSVTIHDNVTYVGGSAFPSDCHIFANESTKALLALWRAGFLPYKPSTDDQYKRPYLEAIGSTQTTITWQLKDKMNGYTYKVSEDNIEDTYKETALYPGGNFSRQLKISKEDVTFSKGFGASTKTFELYLNSVSNTASSLSCKGSYSEIDANVTSQLAIGEKSVDGNTGTLTGLDPNRSYQVKYTVYVPWGTNLENKRAYTKTLDFKTQGLKISTLQPKVISAGNVIVAAESNLDDAETNVGFEWRRTDWSDDFASNTGGAYLYEGTMEGYIRNLYTEKLWKYRPYYLSDSGTYYYGDWVGIDPTNTSYFEPTVHTYAQVNIEGNTALVKGYALRGTDNVVVQGFKYWKRVAGARGNAPAVPKDALTVEASGQVMTAQLTGLDYESDYCYVAFVTTSENETFYGEEQTFRTGIDTSGVDDVRVMQEPEVVARYDLRGRRIDTPQPGINILLMSDGSTRKVFVR